MGIPAVPQSASLAARLATILENVLFRKDLSLCDGPDLPCMESGLYTVPKGFASTWNFRAENWAEMLSAKQDPKKATGVP